MKRILKYGLIVGIVLSIVSYGGLYIAITFCPYLFVDYNNPLFNSNGSRDVLFYAHAFIIGFALSWFWERAKSVVKGHFILQGIEFGAVYALIALLPVMWISFSAMDITVLMVVSWLIYGFIQAVIAGCILAKFNP